MKSMLKKIVEMVKGKRKEEEGEEMITILRKGIKKVVWGLMDWWMYWQINEEYDQVVNRIDNRDGVTKEQVRRMAQMWEGLVKLEDYSSLEPMSKEYWEVMSKVVEELKKLSQREQLIMTTELMDDKVMWLYMKVVLEISNGIWDDGSMFGMSVQMEDVE